MTRVLVINPMGPDYLDAPIAELLAEQRMPGIVSDVVSLGESVPPTAFLPLPSVSMNQLLGRIVRAESDGYDAVVVACAADPGVAEAKSIVGIPVTGPMEAALHTAAALGGHLGIITAKLAPGPYEHQPSTVNWLRDLVQSYGMAHRLAGLRSTHPVHPVGEEAERMLAADPDGLRDLIGRGMADAAAGDGLDFARDLVENDDATALFFACTQWGGLLSPVRRAVDVPVLDPVVDTVRYAALLAEAGS